MRRLALATIAAIALSQPAGATSVERSYSYFTIGGSTLSEIEAELSRRGPTVGTTNRRHPGATRMQFATRVTYGEQGGRCGVVDADVSLSAEMILPRWRVPRNAEEDVRIIWDTLAADIRRHEEAHVVIARNHARELEQALKRVTRAPNCEAAAARVEQVTADVLQRHDEAQARFDRVEAVNFESRLLRLLRYRLERMEDGRLPAR
jgi:predicted secreted Zn-dependent protease